MPVQSADFNITIDNQDIIVRVEPFSDITSVVGFQGPAGPVGPTGINGTMGIDGIPGPPGPASALFIEEFTVTSLELTNKQVTLSFPIVGSTQSLELYIYGGTFQRPGQDFIIIGNNVINWNALALELLLDIGSVIVVRYNIV